MAAPYKVIVSKTICYNSVVLDNKFQNVVHYCLGSCQAHRLGVECLVAHHTVCSELLKAPEATLSHGGDVGNKISVGESVVCGEDYHHLNLRFKKASTIQNTSSLKDITGEAINLASGKTKEFSFEKLKNASNQHVNLRKGRKVRPESFGRKSADYDFIYGQFNNNENCPPFGLLQSQGPEEKTLMSHGTSFEQNINLASLYLQGLSEENLINQILKKHKLDSSGSGEDIKMCLDILLKCSEDLKKCTNIIKQCIKNRSVGGSGSGVGDGKGSDHFPNPEIIYMNVMARLSSYLKKLPFELEQGSHGRTEPNDLAELVKSLNSLQQHPFSPIYGHEQPPKYEDVVQTPPSLKTISSATSENHESTPQRTSDTSTVKSIPDVAPPLPAKTWQRNKQSQTSPVKNNSTTAQQTSPPTHLPTKEKLPRNSTEKLFIEEDSDSQISPHQKKSPTTFSPVASESKRLSAESLCHDPSTSSHALTGTFLHNTASGNAQTLTAPINVNTAVPMRMGRSRDHEEIDKLLLDLEHFSQKIESTLKNPSMSSPAPSKLPTGLPAHNEDLKAQSALGKEFSMSTTGDDDNLLLRILGSIEDFAQELVDWRSGKGTLSKQKEVMQILQETLVPQSPIPSPSFQNQTKDSGSTLSIQQTPEVIKIQNKQEKKPGTPPPAPIIAPVIPRPATPPPAKVIVAPSVSINIPRFYFPKGLPNPSTNNDDSISKIEAAFSSMEDEKADIYEMGKIAKVCDCPLFWKAALFNAAGGERTGFVSVHSFIAMWRKLLQNCHDDTSKFMHLLSKPGCSYLEQEDFIPLLQDIVDTHPGLTFLKEAPEFHSRYITTVIQRIFYTVNRSWSGRITSTEMRRSNFLQTLALLEEEDDINQVTDYFSYEHFYVIYCKFWELDTDHDLYIDQKDLARYNDHASSNRIIERIFSGAVTRGNAIQREGRMSYAEFVWFLISEEDKKNPTSIEYWFRCMDLDGDGVLSMYELEYFYEEQCEKMETMGIEPLPFQDLLCQLLDLVKPEVEGRITLKDLKHCKMAHIFYDTCFNLEKYLDHEQRDPFALQKDVDSETPEPSDWDRYAAEEYEILVAEETATEHLQEGSFEDDYDGDEIIAAPEINNKMDKLVISDLTA
ncbi:serine/threonine-protein phosphatase 2A regulatory subunit B'' subunit alpha isoform X1 [Bufo gargarizans]|uniref:serine/threonine-protein phosphatase 2A regulatory subunit B'' subunit alpha isoform X1 n=1 Tax=Bufo gargarizans TaxID=30331 RepID=UPI001CF18EE8|nr:serine/threonine-protein phosphatase 2A regulatory subunit B'' subunit alpha isoform X1 [Bufo gargarizans]XP_044144707.1 serine/threonine-protein phosphatase 2A regulatory subunit B'' subunit alpha isoform X1 [Bufo gargarizans]XP_044144708.1 serine/threonine-protein phosphatase 2A regulatory subunit B'' subunit alpha isoform X1 [Bufo gargarizans]